MKLKSKVAIVTGAVRGIGRAISIELAREGAAVVISDSRIENVDSLMDEIHSLGGRALVMEADVSDLNVHEHLVASSIEHFGRIDILVNNAGINLRGAYLDVQVDNWDLILGVNLKGPYFLSQKIARHMIQNGQGGKIVNVGSVHDQIPLHQSSIYAISKGGLKMLTKSLALELAEHRINVNAISPGTVLHERHTRLLGDPDYLAKSSEKIPWKRVGRPDDIAGAAVFLASQEADYITGQTLYIDGGLLLN